MTSKGKDQQANVGPAISTSIGDAEPVERDGRKTQLPFPVVAIGASAGGVEVLLRFFRAIPADSGCAFVVVMHLAPDRASNLDTLVGHATSMAVEQAKDGARLEVNRVYIGQPGHDLLMKDGCLVLEKVKTRPPKPTAIDRFMTSLAADQGDRAVGVVMSGSDGDGALGIKAIKSEGGFTVAQLPSSATHPGMPLSAIATGVVDRQLTIEEMPAAIIQFVRHSVTETKSPAEPRASNADLLKIILEHVHDQTGIDFRSYKEPMLNRRVRRRMVLCNIHTEADYLRFLLETPAESGALAADFLISVTEFFREPDAWRTLGQDFIPSILAAKKIGDVVRVWVAGCATGEEAYSVAMLLLEHPLREERRLKVQVFATDIDTRALDVARKGCYPDTIHHVVSRDRLRRFFIRTPEGYRVTNELREAVMFASQDLVADPPFSHLDLVSCRNLLIYMKPDLQRRILQIFHFALEREGILALGKSETAGNRGDLFVPVSQQARIFKRAGAARVSASKRLPLPGGRRPDGTGTHFRDPIGGTDYGRVIREALLDHRIGAAVLTNQDGRSLFFYGPMQPFVAPPEGTPSDDLFLTIREELRPNLRAVLLQAAKRGQSAEAIAATHGDDGVMQPVRLLACAVGRPGDGLLLVTFERLEAEQTTTREPSEGELAAMRALEDELRNTKHELRAVIGELEATNEELKVANEEAMSANEELQSSNEELQTSKEELQAMNEELTTVNSQLIEKVGELEVLNDDLSNLLSSSHIPTLFLDRLLNIKRFTPAAVRLFRLIPGDVNRPVTDLASLKDIDMLVEDAQRVLESLSPIERETRMGDGEYFLRRTLPYRTLQDRIEGVVVTFTDISELKRASENLRRYAAMMRDSNDAVVVYDLKGRILAWNRGARSVYGYVEDDVLGSGFAPLIPEDGRAEFLVHLDRAAGGERLVGVEMRRRRNDGADFDVSATFSLITDDDGQPVAIAVTERDVSRRKEMESEMRESEQRFRSLADRAPALVWTGDSSGALEFVNQEFISFTGESESRLLQRSWIDLLHPDDAARGQAILSTRGGRGKRREVVARLRVAGGSYRWVKITVGPHQKGKLVGSMVDVDAQVNAERHMREANKHKDEFLAMLGHELRNPLVPIRNAAEVLNQVASEDSRVLWVRNTLVRQVEHVTRLVDDLLDISMITRGTMRLHLEPVDLRFVVQRACESSKTLMRRKRHRFECRIADEPLWVEGDAVRLMQILENLLTNAAKYTNDEGEIELLVEREEEKVVIKVTDNGLGIEPEMLTRIFDLFVQDARSIDRSQGGLGIGLALVRNLVDLHGGEIRALSEGLGKGSQVVLRLPLLPESSIPAASEVPTETGSGDGRVMVVDDDVDAGESMEVLLGMYGYEVERAVDLQSALETARRFVPHVVILDLALPGADGFEIARHLRALPQLGRDVSFLSLSGFGQAQDFKRSKEAGFARHLVKPVDPAELRKVLNALLQGGAADHE